MCTRKKKKVEPPGITLPSLKIDGFQAVIEHLNAAVIPDEVINQRVQEILDENRWKNSTFKTMHDLREEVKAFSQQTLSDIQLLGLAAQTLVEINKRLQRQLS